MELQILLITSIDNILSTARADEDSVDFYVYTKDLRESTINMVGSDGLSPVTYNYTDYGETEELGDQDFYNEVCYSAGIYDDTTGLYYLNARYYSPENGAFLTQDTYRGDRSRTATINLYTYCAGNFTDSYFRNADTAKARLALENKPMYIMEFRIKGNINLRGGTRVKPLHGEPGGGREYVTNEIVEIEIVNYQKMVGGR